MSRHPLAGRTVLDAGAGTGAVSSALAAAGARAVAADLSFDMLAWNARARPPCAVADIRALPLPAGRVDDAVAAFVLNHLAEPSAGLAELIRATRPAGAVLAAVFSNASRSQARDRVDALAQDAGWQVPDWYVDLKTNAVPILGTAVRGTRTGRSRARDIRRRMLLGCRGSLPPDPRGAADRCRLHRRERPGPHLRTGLQAPHRPRRGGRGLVRPGPGQLRGVASGVLADPQSGHPQPPGLRFRQPVPLGDLLPCRGSRT